MPRKRYAPEEIVAKLRQVDVLVSQGQSMADAIRHIGIKATLPLQADFELSCLASCKHLSGVTRTARGAWVSA